MISIRRPVPAVLLFVLLSVAAVIVLFDVAAWWTGVDIGERLSLDAEASLPAWWAAVQLLLLASLLGIASVRESRADRSEASRALAVAAFGAAYLSLDESVAIHEGITTALAGRSWIPTFNGDHGVWIFVYSIIGVLLVAILWRGIASLLRTNPTDTSLVALGAALFVLGGVVIEAIGYTFPSRAQVVVEEMLEFVGVAVMVWATYRMLGDDEVRLPRIHTPVSNAEGPRSVE